MIKTIRLEEAPAVPNPAGLDARRLYDTEHAQVLHISLKPGERVERHIVPVDVAFFVLEGEGEFEIGDEKVTAGAGTLVESPGGLMRGMSNAGAGNLNVMIVRAPRPGA